MGRPKMTEAQKADAKAEREAKNNKAEEGAAAEPTPPVVVEPEAQIVKPESKLLSLADFIESHQNPENPLTFVRHPQATGDIFASPYSGVRTQRGDPFAQWADGTHT